MVTSAALFYMGEGTQAEAVYVDDFEQSPLFDLTTTRLSQIRPDFRNRQWALSLRTFIESTQMSSLCSQFAEHTLHRIHKNSMAGLVQATKAFEAGEGFPVEVEVFLRCDGHAMLPYRVVEADTFTRVYVYDPNYPNEDTHYITLTREADGSYSDWTYPGFNDPEEERRSLSYTVFSGDLPLWLVSLLARQGITVSTAEVGTGKTYETWEEFDRDHPITFATGEEALALNDPAHNTLMVENRDFTVRDEAGELLARVEDGLLTEAAEGVEQIIVYGDGETAPAETATLLKLPITQVTIRGTDTTAGITAAIANVYEGASIETTASAVALLARDDSEDVPHAAYAAALEEGASFTVRLDLAPAAEGEHYVDYTISGTAGEGGTACAVVGETLYVENGEGETDLTAFTVEKGEDRNVYNDYVEQYVEDEDGTIRVELVLADPEKPEGAALETETTKVETVEAEEIETSGAQDAVDGKEDESGSGDSGNTGEGGESGSGDSGSTGEGGESGSGDSGNTGEGGESGSGDSGNTGEGGESGSGDSGSTGEGGESGSGDSGSTGEGGEGGSGDSGNTGEGGESGSGDSGNTGEGGEGGSGDSGNTGEGGDSGSGDSGNTGNTGNGGSGSGSGSGGGTGSTGSRPIGSRPSKPAAPVETTPEPEAPPQVVAKVELPFVDVAKDSWYYENVQWAYGRSVILGTSDTTFEPEITVTRAMLVTILYRLAGEPQVTGTVPFQDVRESDYFYKAVVWAREAGIVQGYDPQTFGASDGISRQDLIVIFNRYARHMGYDVTADGALEQYTDWTTVRDYATGAMAWAISHKLIGGYPDGSLKPGGTATRAEVVTILKRFADSLPGITL